METSVYIAAFVFGLIFATCVVVLVVMYKGAKKVAQVQDAVHDLAERFFPIQERVKMVEGTAVDYANSLGSEAISALEILQRRLGDMEFLLNEIQALLEDGQADAIREVDLYLRNAHPRQQHSETSFDGTHHDLRIDPNWEEEFEYLIQKVGKVVSSASLSATKVGLPKRRKPQSTLFTLFKAGIKMDKGPYEW